MAASKRPERRAPTKAIGKVIVNDSETGMRTVRWCADLDATTDSTNVSGLVEDWRRLMYRTTPAGRLEDMRFSAAALAGLPEDERARELIEQLASIIAHEVGPKGQHTPAVAERVLRLQADFEAVWQLGQRRKELRAAHSERDGLLAAAASVKADRDELAMERTELMAATESVKAERNALAAGAAALERARKRGGQKSAEARREKALDPREVSAFWNEMVAQHGPRGAAKRVARHFDISTVWASELRKRAQVK